VSRHVTVRRRDGEREPDQDQALDELEDADRDEHAVALCGGHVLRESKRHAAKRGR
jgi:hypothetical protein